MIEFLKILDKNKNIIYTFSRIYEELLSNLFIKEYIETNKFGNISKSNIKIIQISSINSEKKLEKFIYDLKKEENIVIFKLKPSESEVINYLNNYIKQMEAKNNDLKNKVIIFIIYLKRKIDKEKEDELYDVISFLNEEYDQIFIDNLNGKNENINILIENSRKNQIFSEEIEPIIYDNIDNLYSYIKFNIKGKVKGLDKNNNYTKYIIESIKKNKRLKKIIISNIDKLNISKKEDIVEAIFKKNEIKSSSIDYISIIYKYYKENILDSLKQIIFIGEKNTIFSPFLIKDEKEETKIIENKYITKIMNDYFDNVKDNGDSKFFNDSYNNSIDILLGIKIPGIKPIIEKMINYINETSNLSKDYFEKEGEEKDVTKIVNKLNKYLEKFPIFNEISNDLKNNEFDKDLKDFLEMLYSDYLYIFLNNHEKDLLINENYNCNLQEDFMRLIRKMIDIRFDFQSNGNSFERILRYILWI